MKKRKIVLTEDEMPRQWYNILADIKMNPPLGPDGNPVGPEQLAPVFPMNLIEQEVSQERWIDIPEEILEIYSMWRPSPLYRAKRLEKMRFCLRLTGAIIWRISVRPPRWSNSGRIRSCD